MTVPKPPEHIAGVLRRLAGGGYEAYLVGGCVRDSIMGRQTHDWDVASSATPEEVCHLFRKTATTGEKYGTVSVILPECVVEVTTFRREGSYRDGRRPEIVEFVTRINEDLSRRDFTMNAMAASLSTELIDPYGGLADIGNRVIRCVGDPSSRFSEDALRMLRAFRFRAELGFEIEAETLKSMLSNSQSAGRISPERVRVELEKTLLSERPETAWDMIEAGLLDNYIPRCCSAQETRAVMPEASSISYVLPEPQISGAGSLAALSRLPAEAALRWCAFCAILITRRMIGSGGEFLRSLRLDAKTIKACCAAVPIAVDSEICGALTGGSDGIASGGGTPVAVAAPDRVTIKKLLAARGIPAVRCAAAASDALRGSNSLSHVESIIGSGECFSLRELAISGGDLIELGCSAGAALGGKLGDLLDYVISHPECNTREKLIKLASCDML